MSDSMRNPTLICGWTYLRCPFTQSRRDLLQVAWQGDFIPVAALAQTALTLLFDLSTEPAVPGRAITADDLVGQAWSDPQHPEFDAPQVQWHARELACDGVDHLAHLFGAGPTTERADPDAEGRVLAVMAAHLPKEGCQLA